jgi:hypothetical protein
MEVNTVVQARFFGHVLESLRYPVGANRLPIAIDEDRTGDARLVNLPEYAFGVPPTFRTPYVG